MTSPHETRGRVDLVGAGPGDPGLLTLRGLECLRRADVVLFDYLVNPQLLTHASPDAELVCLGKHGEGRVWPQSKINRTIVELALAGKAVCRLKGGDPAVFARGAEELEALVAAGVRYEVVPGITAALAASSFAGIPLTHRDLSSAVALVTGQQAADNTRGLDFEALAKFPGTLVFYMGVTTADRWSTELIAAGKSAATPAAIIRRCTLPDQRFIECTLGEIPLRLNQPPRVRPPAIVIVGDVVGLAPRFDWFQTRPLFGCRVLVTRPRAQAASLADLLQDNGAEVITEPVIEIQPPADWTDVDVAIDKLGTYDWILFTSANSVRTLLDRVRSKGHDARALGGLRIAAIGPGTSAALERYGLRADLQPARHRGEDFAAELTPVAQGQRFLLPCGSRGRVILQESLRAAGGQVDPLVVYRSLDVPRISDGTRARLQAGEIAWATVTSPAIARCMARLFGEDLRNCRLASISPLTTQALRDLGLEPAAEATDYSMPGLVEAILNSASA